MQAPGLWKQKDQDSELIIIGEFWFIPIGSIGSKGFNTEKSAIMHDL